MSDKQSALAQLRDIHLPTPINWWPPAPGWFMLAGLLILAIGLALYFIHRQYYYGRAKRRALQLLRGYEQQYQKEQNTQAACARVSQLLRRVALVYYPRRDVAALQGQQWVSFLDNTAKRVTFASIQDLLLSDPYQANSKNNPQRLFAQARVWIKQRSVPCLN